MTTPNALQDLANSLAPYLAHTDSAAIHDDVAGEITAIAAKAAPLIDDEFILEDTSDSGDKKSATLGSMLASAGQVTNLPAKATPTTSDKIAIEDAADGAAMKEVTIGALPIAQAQVASILLEPVADAAVALLNTTSAVVLIVTGAATVAISTTSRYAGQEIQFFASAVAGGGSYTLAVQGGTLTIDAAGEAPKVKRNAGDSAWVVIGLGGATIV